MTARQLLYVNNNISIVSWLQITSGYQISSVLCGLSASITSSNQDFSAHDTVITLPQACYPPHDIFFLVSFQKLISWIKLILNFFWKMHTHREKLNKLSWSKCGVIWKWFYLSLGSGSYINLIWQHNKCQTCRICQRSFCPYINIY